MNGERRSEGGGVGGAGDAAPGGVNSILWNRWEGDAPENIRDYLERGERFPALPGVYEAGAALVVVGFVLRVGRASAASMGTETESVYAATATPARVPEDAAVIVAGVGRRRQKRVRRMRRMGEGGDEVRMGMRIGGRRV